jgi:hypothetical protein
MEALKSAILYFDFNKVYFFGSNISDRVLSFNIPQSSIRELDVISNEELINLIKSFTQYYKITPVNLSIIFSENVCFESKMPQTTEKNSSEVIQYFLDLIPFENVVDRVFIWEKESIIVATNMQLCQILKKSFEMMKFTVESIIPAFVLGKDIDLKNGLDLVNSQKIIGKIDTLKQFDFLKDQNIQHPISEKSEVNKPSAENNKTLIFLLPVLVLLIIIFAFVLAKSQSPLPLKKTSVIFELYLS